MANDIFDPLEEGAEEVETPEQKTELDLSTVAQLFEQADREIRSNRRDLSENYNTDLGDLEDGYQSWLAAIAEKEGLDPNAVNYDYDTRGLFQSTNGTAESLRNAPETFKKPNHPTFSVDSRYHGMDGYEGGLWTKDGKYEASRSNFYDPDELRGYFEESGSELIDNRERLSQTELLAARLRNDDADYSYVMSNIDAQQEAMQRGDRTIGEVFREAFDPQGDNLFGRLTGIILGGALGAGAGAKIGSTVGSIFGPVGSVILGVVGAAMGGLLGDSAALWVSESDERDIREDLIDLDTDNFKTDFEREEAERRVAEWYNERNIERRRDQKWTATVADIFLESLPYMASFLTPGKAVAGSAIKAGQSAKKVADAARLSPKFAKGATEALEQYAKGKAAPDSIAAITSSPFAVTREQSKTILKWTDRITRMDKSRPRGQVMGDMMQAYFKKNIEAYLKSKPVRIGIQGTASLGIQQPKIFSDLRQEQLESVTINKDGGIELDDSMFEAGSLARKQAVAYSSILVETVGFEMAGKLLKAAGVQKALKPLVDKITSSVPSKLAGTGKGVEHFFKNTRLGKSLAGKTELMKQMHSRMALGGTLEEFSEEYIEMTLQATLGLDKDDREKQDLSYAQNLVDKWFFPALHPKEASAMLVSFGILPTGAAAVSALRGDQIKEEYQDTSKLVEKIVHLRTGRAGYEVEELAQIKELVGGFLAKRTQKSSNPIRGKFLDFIFRPSGEDAFSEALFNKRMPDLVKQIQKRAQKLSGEKNPNNQAIAQASNEMVAELMYGRIYETAAQKAAGEKLIKSGQISELIYKLDSGSVQGLATPVDIGGDTGFSVNFVIDESRRKELSENKELKPLLDSKGVVSIGSSEQAAARRDEATAVKTTALRQLSDKINDPKAKPAEIEAAYQRAIDSIKKQVGLSVIIDGASEPGTAKVVDQNIREMVNQLAVEVSRHPSIKIKAIPTSIVRFGSALDAAGNTGRSSEAQLIEASNVDGEILLSPAFTSRSGARVVEEEYLEQGYKARNGTKPTRRSSIAMDSVRTDLQAEFEGEDEARSDAAAEALKFLGESPTERQAFESYIALIQGLFGNQSKRSDKWVKGAVDLLSEDTINRMAESVNQSFTKGVVSSLNMKFNPAQQLASEQAAKSDAAEAESEEKEVGKKAVEKFVETKGKAIDEKVSAISVIKERLGKKDLIKSRDARALAEMVLEELEKGRTGKKPHRKTKAEVQALHDLAPDLTYSTKALPDSLSTDEEYSNEEDSSWQDKSPIEKGMGIYLVSRMMEDYHGRNASRYIMRLGKEKFLAKASSSKASWETFLGEDENKGNFLERMVRRIANEEHPRINAKTGTEETGRMTYDEIYAFMKFRSSLHMFPQISYHLPLEGKSKGYVDQNRYQIVDEMIAYATDYLNDEANAEQVFVDKLAAYAGGEEAMYEFIGELLGQPGGMIADIDQAQSGKKLIDRVFTEADKKWLEEHGSNLGSDNKLLPKIISNWVKRDRDAVLNKGFASAIGEGIGHLDRLDPTYTNVKGDTSSSLIGDSHLIHSINAILDEIGVPWEMAAEAVSFLDGVTYSDDYKDRSQNRTSDSLEGEELEEILYGLFVASSKRLADTEYGSFYLNHLGRFGEKGKMPFIWQPYYGQEEADLRPKAEEASKLLAKESKAVQDMFNDPLVVLNNAAKSNGRLGIRAVADVHYAIHALGLAKKQHGNLDVYATKDTGRRDLDSAMNTLNLVARASQELTDGIAYDGEMNLILVDNIASIVDGMDSFDGQAAITQLKAREIAYDYGIELMGGLESADSFKGHISNVLKGERTLVKVDWHNIEKLLETAPEWKAINDYIENWNLSNPGNRIDGVVFGSGAKFINVKKTDWKNNKPPEIANYPKGSLIRSQDLTHENDVLHEGLIPRQRIAHMLGLTHRVQYASQQLSTAYIYANPARRAADIRTEVSVSRKNKDLPELLKEDKLVGPKAPPAILSARQRQESMFDPRYYKHILNQSFSAISKALRPNSARVALQKVGEGSSRLKGYELVSIDGTEGSDVVRLPEARMNIVGARYAVKENPATGKPFKTRLEARIFVEKNAHMYPDMFWPDNEGRPGQEVMVHELRETASGNWLVPGEVAEETRVPSGAYASHTFMRLMEPASKDFLEDNISVTPEGIRVAKGEDFDGDKGFVSLFYKRVNKSVENGMYEMVRGKLVMVNPDGEYNLSPVFSSSADRETDRSKMNRALSLEHILWIHPDTYSYYQVEGDMPKGAFDEALVNKSREDSPLLPAMKVGSIKGIGAASTVNYVRQKTIGVEAVYNSMYSIFASSGESIKLGRSLQDRWTDKHGNSFSYETPFAGISFNGIEIKDEMSFENYHSVKRLIDVFLNVALDDHKDPRLSFINLNADTAGIFTFLLMNNVNTNDIPADNTLMAESAAFKDAVRVMEFLNGKAMNNYAALRRRNRSQRVNPYAKSSKPDAMVKELVKLGSSEEEARFVMALHMAGSRLFDFTRIVNSSYVTADGLPGYFQLLNSWGRANNGFDGLFDTEQSRRLFTNADTKANPSFRLAAETFKEMDRAAGKTPVVQIVANVYKDIAERITDEAVQEAFLKSIPSIDSGILISAVRGQLSSDRHVASMNEKARKLVSSNSQNALVRQLEHKDGRIGLRISMRKRELTEAQVSRTKEAFEALSDEQREALAVAAFSAYGPNASNWSGSWAMFISDDYSKYINSNIKRIVDSVKTTSDLAALMGKAEAEVPELALLEAPSEEARQDEFHSIREKTPPAESVKAPEKPVKPVSKQSEAETMPLVASKVSKALKGGYRGLTLVAGKKHEQGAFWNRKTGKMEIDIRAINSLWNKRDELVSGYELRDAGQLAEFVMEKAYHESKGSENATEAALQNLGIKRFGDETFSSIGIHAETLGSTGRAERLEDEGKSRNEIFYETGWWRGLDGQWRYELTDILAKAKFLGARDILPETTDAEGNPRAIPLGDILHHRLLYEAYPEMKSLPVHISTDIENDPPAAYYEEDGYILLRVDQSGKQMLDNLLHEAQHHIQKIEGWARGSSTVNELSNIPNLDVELAKRNYLLSAGEVEARNTMFRNNLTQNERHNRKPWETIVDVLNEDNLLEPGQKPEDVVRIDGTPRRYVELPLFDGTFYSVAFPRHVASMQTSRLPLLTDRQQRALAGTQLLPPVLKRLLARHSQSEGTIHWIDIVDRFRTIDQADQMHSDNPRAGKYEARVVARAAKAVSQAMKKIASFDNLPGDLQEILAQRFSQTPAEVLDLIDSYEFGEAALRLVKNISRPHWQTELADMLIGYDALLSTVSNRKAPPSPLLESTQSFKTSPVDLYAYANKMDLPVELEPLGIELPKLLASRSYQARSLAKLQEGDNHPLTAQVRKLIRLANGVPTKRESANEEAITETPEPNEQSYSAVALDMFEMVEQPRILEKFGSALMQEHLIKASRHGRETIHQGVNRRSQLLRRTAGATWIDPKTYKTIRTTSEGRSLGKAAREALTYLAELYPAGLKPGWESVIMATKEDHIEKTGEGWAFTESAPSAAAAIQLYETWRSKEAPHLPPMGTTQEIDAMVSEVRSMYINQRDLLNEAAGWANEEWIKEYTESGYVNHVYKSKIRTEFEDDSIQETATQEQGRIHPTYRDAALKAGLIPRNLDAAWLMNRYTEETSRVIRNRSAVTMMATTSDEDLMPMMIFEGPQDLGIITEPVAKALAERLEAGMSLIRPDFTFKTKRVQDGFSRLQGMLSEINPNELGYRRIETGFDSVRTAWVKEGAPYAISKHIFGDQKRFQHEWARKAFNAVLALNHTAKSMSIFLSLFHPFALVESFVAIDGIGGLQGKGNLLMHPKKTWQELKKSYYEGILNPDANTEWVMAGLSFDNGRAPDYEYVREHNRLSKIADDLLDKGPVGKLFGTPLATFAKFKHKTDAMMWEVMLPAMKVYSANRLFQAEMERHDMNADPDKLREDISAYVNDAFGGQEWEKYLWANPRTRKWLHMFMFAPDWTISALNISGVTHVGPVAKAFGPPRSQLHARNRMERYWPAFFGIVLMGIPNMLQAMIYGLAKATGTDDEDDNLLAFSNEAEHKFEIDVTPFLRLRSLITGGVLDDEFGKTKNRRVYIRFGKQAYEVFEGWLGGPESLRDTMLGKSSIGVKLVQEQIFNQIKPGWDTPWAEHGFLESIIAVDGKLWDGRAAGVIKKFTPMSIQPFFDELSTPGTGKPAAFIAPARLGMNSYNAQKEIASTLRAYVEGGMKANIKGLPRNADLESMAGEVLDAARKNGYDPDKVFGQGLSAARSFYYANFFEALEKGQSDRMEIAAEALIILDSKYKNFQQSVKNRLETQGRNLDPETRQTIRDKWFDGMERAAKKGRR